MKKIFLYLALLCAPLVLVSCESDDKSDSNNFQQRDKSIVVSGRSTDVINGQQGDIYQYSGEGWRVVVTDKTKIYVQRPSCSGLQLASPGDVSIGFTIFFKHYPEEVDYIGPNTVRASIIEAYRPECLSAEGALLVITNTTTSTQTVTTTTITTNIVRR